MPRLPDVICLSHLRWDFVFQRPNHLMSRCARDSRVFFFEEPLYGAPRAELVLNEVQPGLTIARPHLPDRFRGEGAADAQREMLDGLMAREGIDAPLLWVYSPTALVFARHLRPSLTVYDCMDELSAFRGAPPELRTHEAELFSRADIVFTGGESLYEAKRSRHPNVHAFPSSVDVGHFKAARTCDVWPSDQEAIPGPRIGFFGVIDERMNLGLVDAIARARPDWHIVMLGPVVKIDPSTLPQRPNLHWLGGKSYGQLPEYIAQWDVAMMPFAKNESTSFISPTKTLEYLAAGKPVVSTSIRDVVRPYGDLGLVRIADDAPAFVSAIEIALIEEPGPRTARADAFLSGTSWDRTWGQMRALLDAALTGAAQDRAPASSAMGAA